jgi:hypothetical protein
MNSTGTQLDKKLYNVAEASAFAMLTVPNNPNGKAINVQTMGGLRTSETSLAHDNRYFSEWVVSISDMATSA